MRFIVMSVLLTLLAVAQSSVLSYFRLYSGQPNLILLLVTAWAVHAEWDEAILWAFVGGALQDLMSIAPLGTSIVPLIVTVFVVKLMVTQVEGLKIVIYLGVAIIGTFFAHIFLFIMLGVVGYPIDLIPTIRYFMLPSLVYQMVVALPMYGVARLLQGRVPLRQTAF